MKNILFILSFICISCNAQQQIIPLGTKGFHIEGAYYKDISGDLNAYEGTWQGVFNNRTFIITFIKVKELEPIGKYYQDRLLGRYKMLDGNGNQLYSTYNLVDKDVKVTSLGFVNSTSKNKLRFYFSDLCRGGQIVLNFENPQKTQMHYIYYSEQELITDETGCSPYNEMPKGEMTLIKQ